MKARQKHRMEDAKPDDFIDPETPYGHKKLLAPKMKKKYNPTAVEKSWYAWWESSGYFGADSASTKPPFVMVLPPPGVTGALPIGHALTVVIEDVIVRWRRMSGYNALWIPGLDLGGLTTQLAVEEKLMRERKLARHEIGREELVNEAFKLRECYGGTIVEQSRRLGASLDWSRKAFTMDDQRSNAVNEAFVRLHDAGFIYRDNCIVNWDCTLRSAISDMEVHYMDLKKETLLKVPGYADPVEFGTTVSFAYPIEDLVNEIYVSTRRIETMLGDTAIAVHPDDERFAYLHGKNAVHPFIEGRKLKIICDESVDPAFGTGAVKISPAHDPIDFEIGKRHNLDCINILTDDGKINGNGGKIFEGMPRFTARVALIEALKERGLYENSKRVEMSLGVCIGTNDVVEPMIKPQWFVNCKTMAKAGLDALKSKKIEIIPQHSGKKLDRWLGNTHDWCVSRQLWCGHPLPAWYVTLGDDQDKKIGSNCDRWIVARSESDANVEAQKKYPGKTFRLDQDTDVLDTWFSYGLFLLTTLGWPEENAEMRAFFLTSVLDTEVDNLLMWVARMVMMGVQLVGDVPFQKVYLHPTVCDKSGKKMSKSLGNFIDPLEVINGMSLEDLLKTLEEEGNLDPNELNIAKEGKKKQFPDGIVNCGADALRFGLISYTSQCASINFDTSNIVKCRRSCSKLWNSFHVGLSILGDYTPTGTVDVHFIPPICNWILSVLNKAVDKTVTSLEAYRLSDAASAISSWWQHDFDIFLEAIPVHGSARAASRDTLWFCLDCGLRLLHPFMPYVTEELWQRLPQPKDSCRKESIMISEYPSVTKDWSNGNLENEMAIVFAAAEKIKSLKPSADSNERQHAFALCRSREMVTTMLSHRSLTAQLSSIPHLKILRVNDKAPDGCAAAVVNKDLTVYRQYKGAFNTNGEREKLRKKRDEVLKLQEALTRKMNDSIYQENVTKKIKEGDTRNLRVLLEKLDVISECEMELDAVKESFESPLSLKINATCKPESLPEMSELGHAAPIALDQGAQIEERFLAFLRGFKLNGHLFYKNVCEALCSMQSNVISIDYGHLKLFDPSLANTVAIFSKRVQKHLINGTKIFILKEVGSRCENLVVKICDLPRFSLIPLKEFWDLPGHHPSEEVDIYCGDMSLTITKTTPSGRIPFYNLLRKLFSSFEKGNSWNGTWRIEDVFVDPITYQIEIIKAFCGRCNFGTMQNDLRRCVTGVIPEFNCGGHLPAFFTDLKCTLDEFVPERQLNPATWKKFRDFVIAHLSLKPPLTRSNFFDNLHEMMQSLDDGGRKILQSILTAGYLLENDWGAFFKNKSGLNPMFAVVYEHNKKKKEKIDQERKADTGKKKKRGARNAGCNTAGSVQGGGSAQEQQSQAPVEKPEQVEVFEKALEGLLIFSRHVKQHGTQGSRDKHGEQTLERLSEIDLVTSHYLEELIAIVHQLIYEIDHEDLDMDSVDYKKFRTMFEEIFEEYNAPEAVPLLNRQNEVETFAFFEHNENRAFTIEDPRQEMVDLQDVKAGLQKNDCAGGEGVKPIFSGAIIEVCMRMLVFYPEVVGFLEGEKDDFPYVEARYSLDSPPKLIMLDDKGEHKETISIGNWKRENIRQFLKEKVKPVKSSS